MIQKLNDDKLEREQNGGDCYKPIAWDPNPWKCPKVPEENVDTTPVPNTSLLVKSLK